MDASILFVAAGLRCSRACDQVKFDQSLDLYVVQPVNKPFIELQSNGLAVAQSPPMYQSSEPSFPIETVVSEGIDVEPGDPLMTLCAKEAENWSVKSMYGIKHNEAKLQFNWAEVGKKVTGLELQRENIERQIVILEAQTQATRRQDENQIQITELQVKRTIETLNAAELHLARLRTLESSMVSQRQ